MVETYKKERQFAENNPGVHPQLRKYFAALNAQITWPTTTTTVTTTTTTTTTTTSTTVTTTTTTTTT